MCLKTILCCCFIFTKLALKCFPYMLWLYVCIEMSFPFCFMFTVLTLICFTLMYWLYVLIKIALMSWFIFTMLTLECFSFMYWLYVSLKIAFLGCFIFTIFTLKCFPSMYWLYVCFETALLGCCFVIAKLSQSFHEQIIASGFNITFQLMLFIEISACWVCLFIETTQWRLINRSLIEVLAKLVTCFTTSEVVYILVHRWR